MLILDFDILGIIFMGDFIICWDTSAVHTELEKLTMWKLRPFRCALSTETSVFFGGGSENGISTPTCRRYKNLSLHSEEERHRHRKEATWRWRQRLEVCGHKPRDAGSPQKLEEAGRILPWSLFFFFLIFFPPWSLLRKQDTDLGLRLLFSRTSASAQSLSHVQLFAAPWTVACQAPLFTEFSRQEYWRGLLFPTPGDPLDWGTMNICCLRPQFGVFCYSCPRPLTHW